MRGSLPREPAIVLRKKFEELAPQGLNCKQIAKEMGYHPTCFGKRMKKVLGIYPSVYIARKKWLDPE